MKIKTILKLFSIIVCVFFTVCSFGQLNVNPTPLQTGTEQKTRNLSEADNSNFAVKKKDNNNVIITLCKEIENTYQIIVLDPRIKIALTSDICEIVKRERKKSETVFYPIDKFIKLKIYSSDELKGIKKPFPLIIYNE